MARNVVAVEDRGSAEYVTNWSAVFLAGGIGALCLAGVAAAALVAAFQPETPRNYSFTLPTDTARDATRLALLRTLDADVDLAPTPQDFGIHFPAPSPGRAVQQAIANGVSVALKSSPWRWLPLLASPPSAATFEPVLAAIEVENAPDDQPIARIRSDNDLYDYLLQHVVELDLESSKGTVKSLFAASDVKQQRPPLTTAEARDDQDLIEQFAAQRQLDHHRHLHLEMLQRLAVERTDLHGLPLRDLGECVTPPVRAKHNQAFTTAFRDFTSGRRRRSSLSGSSNSFNSFAPSTSMVIDELARAAGDTPQEQVTIIEQIVQAEPREFRGAFVEVLARLPGEEAASALARRAMFDVDESVRAQAVGALSNRPDDQSQAALEAGLRHPLATVQANARFALQRPHSRHLKHDLDVPARHITSPYRNGDDVLVVDELVKVNHLRNCVLCHPKSAVKEDLLRGQIPTPGEQLPRIYYNSHQGNFVRADVVYLRQDFSLNLPVKNADPWPEVQRYDFFVRTRPATSDDLERDRNAQSRAHAAARNRLAAILRSLLVKLESSLTQRQPAFAVRRWN